MVAKELPDDVSCGRRRTPPRATSVSTRSAPRISRTPLTPSGPNTWVARVAAPAEGWTAFFVELTFPGAGKYPLKVTSGIRVLPDKLPFDAPKPVKDPRSVQPVSR